MKWITVNIAIQITCFINHCWQSFVNHTKKSYILAVILRCYSLLTVINNILDTFSNHSDKLYHALITLSLLIISGKKHKTHEYLIPKNLIVRKYFEPNNKTRRLEQRVFLINVSFYMIILKNFFQVKGVNMLK